MDKITTGKKLLLSLIASSCGLLCTPASAQTEPIVFVHGYANNTGVWDTMASRFVSSGYPSAKLYRFGYSSTIYSNKTSASQLKTFISNVRANSGNAAVSVIGHSNGGLVTRWYSAKLGGATSIRRFISLGTPHRGSSWAYGCYSPVCYEMRPGSSFLTDLNGAGCDRSLWSSNDGLVVPAENAKCGTSVQTASVKHMDLITDQSVYNQVRQQLQ